MSHKIAEVVLASQVASGGTITVAYPDNTSAGSFAPFGHKMYARGLQAKFSVDAGDLSMSFGGSNITATYKGATAIPANTKCVFELNELGEGGTDLPDTVVPAIPYRLKLGAPDTADPDGIAETQSASGAHNLVLNGAYADPYGGVKAVLDVPRNIVVDSGGADTAVLTIYGKDVYGQAMVESITLNGTTAVAGKKAFKEINRIAASATIANGAFVGTGDVFGLPAYVSAASQVLASIEDGVFTYALGYDGDTTGDPVAVTSLLAGTLVVGDQSTPTATTGDVRGTFDPTTAANGAKSFELLVLLTDPEYRGVENYAG